MNSIGDTQLARIFLRGQTSRSPFSLVLKTRAYSQDLLSSTAITPQECFLIRQTGKRFDVLCTVHVILTFTSVVAIYTINTPQRQTQDIAFSYDGGYTFEVYENNPVLEPGGTNPGQFRDPKVIWYEPTESWVMVRMTFKCDTQTA